MKISFIATTTYSTPPRAYGGEIFWWDLCECFDKLGHEVTLYAAPGSKCPPNGKLHYIAPDTGALTVYASVDPMRIIYREELLASDYIIDASHTKPTMEEIAYFHKEARWKTIGVLNGVVSHTPICPKYNIVVGSDKWRWLLLNGYTQFIGTPYEASLGGYLTPLKQKDIVAVIPWAVNTEFYCPEYAVDGHGDPYMAKKEDYFLWFSRPTPYKGLGKAIKLAISTKIKLKLAMPMELPEHLYWGTEFLKQIDEARKDGASIEFVKLPNDDKHHLAKRELYRKAKALLFTIECHEPFGLVVAEALACGTPVIATNMGAMPEIIQHGHTGYLVSVESDTDVWHRTINWINEGLISPEDCRKAAVERFDRMVAAERYLKLYEWLKSEGWRQFK